MAIVPAIANEPRLVLADEPTGKLVSRSWPMIYELLHEISREQTVVAVTLATDLARLADRILQIRVGRLAAAVTPEACRQGPQVTDIPR